MALLIQIRNRMSTDVQPGPSSHTYADALKRSDSASDPKSPPPHVRILGALLFAGGQPLTVDRICDVIDGVAEVEIPSLIGQLNRAYRRQNRPYAIEKTGDGFVLSLRSRHQELLKRMNVARESRLSKSGVEVLSLIAFRQPVSRAQLNELRSADSGPVIRQLIRLGLVAVQDSPENGADARYGTTARFLELFGLDSLADLPQTLELQHL